MVRREVERAEVVPVRLGLRALSNRETKFSKYRLDLLDDERDRMFGAAPLAAGGQRQGFAGRRGRAATEQRLPLGVQRFEAGARFVEPLPRRRLVLFGNAAQRFLQRLDAALAIAEERDACLLERVGIAGALERGNAFAFDRFGFVEIVLEIHRVVSWMSRPHRWNQSERENA